MATPRKTTRFAICTAHQSWFAGMTRRRVAECWVEGGPWSGGNAGPCATADPCRAFPGLDFYSEWALPEVATIAETWAVNGAKTETVAS